LFGRWNRRINTVQVGNLVGPSTVLTAVSQVSPIKVYFPISEQEYLRMADGGGPGSVDFNHARFTNPIAVDSRRRRTYRHPGRIIFADRQVNTQTGTIQIVGGVHQFQESIATGQYARIQAPTGNITEALLVPQAAVNQQQGTYQVTVVGTDNRASSVLSRSGESWPALGNHIRLETGRTSRCRRRRENAKRTKW